MRSSLARSGTVLIIVVALAAMLAALAAAFFTRMRSEADEGVTIMQEAQARIMLIAAMQHLLESQRLGWGEETAGWTDVRTGWPGPLGPLTTKASSRDLNGDGLKDDFLPEEPVWWRGDYGAYPPPSGFPYEIYNSASARNQDQPTATDIRSSLRWPAPGSVLRGDTYVMKRPPCALQLTYAYNPVPILDEAINDIQDTTRDTSLTDAYQNGVGALEPQPLAGNFNDFVLGDTAPIISSTGLSWFRIYRETPREKDGMLDADGHPDPYYDLVAFPSDDHATFVIACGSGGSRGFRFWHLPTSDPRRALESVTASESGYFSDEYMFNELKRFERILWFRVAVSAGSGGAAQIGQYVSGGPLAMEAKYSKGYGVQGALERGSSPNAFGSILWIQRLEMAPEKW